MLKLENEYYIRLILLLVKGGTFILRKTVNKGLEKRKESLDDFLKKLEDEVSKSEEISKTQRDCFYPPSQHSSDISKWDISMLSYIALNLGSAISGPEKIAIKKIKVKMKTICEHSADATFEKEMFSSEWTELSLMFETLSKKISDNDKQEMTDLIATLSREELDIYNAIEELKHVEMRDEFSKCIQESLSHLQKSLADGKFFIYHSIPGYILLPTFLDKEGCLWSRG